MPVVTMPQLGEGIRTAVIHRWLKQEGDLVAVGDPLLEIDTDKAQITIDATEAGRLGAILVRPGETVKVWSVLARLDEATPSTDASLQERLASLLDARSTRERVEAAGALGRTERAGVAAALQEAMCNDPEAAVRYAAADALSKHANPVTLDTFVLALGDVDPDVRRLAAEVIGRFGEPRVLDAVIQKLDDEDVWTRCAAARALGQIGDERALGPLTEKLAGSFARGSARQQRMLGLWLLVGGAVLFVGMVTGAAAVGASGAIGVLVQFAFRPIGKVYEKRREQGPFIQAVTEAITQIAEKSPAPALTRVAAELREVAADPLQQAGDTRRASREAAKRIESLIAHLRELPLAASSPEPAPEALPMPASRESRKVEEP